MNSLQEIKKSIAIQAPPSAVWRALTDVNTMQQWMAEPDMNLRIITNWQVGSTIQINGFHHLHFENTGIILDFNEEQLLSYSHLSSLSNLKDEPSNYTIFQFYLTPSENNTLLSLTINNFPTLTIYKHLELYWNITLTILKTYVEKTIICRQFK